jgi:hypothetical protein
MNIAGKFLSLTQGLAESALLAPLRAKYKLQFNLPVLAQRAKEELRDLQMPINPRSLVQMADELAQRETTMLEDRIGIDYTRWNPKTMQREEYIFPDSREYFIR